MHLRTAALTLLLGAVALLAACGGGSGADAPATPSDLTALPGDGNVVLRWDANADSPAGYAIFQGSDANDLSEITEVPGGTTEYTAQPLDNGTRYAFAVAAESADGTRSSRTSAVFATPSADASPEAPTFEVEPTLEPRIDTVPGKNGSGPRPVARIADERGNAADFVADEVVLQTGDDAVLQAFLDRWNGTVLGEIDLSAVDASFEPVYLVKVDPAGAATGDLGADLQALDPGARGPHDVSSEAGLDTLAVAADESAAGVTVGINVLLANDDIFGGSTAEQSGLSVAGFGPDAFTWPYMTRGPSSTQNMGVAAAWQALEAAGVLDRTPSVRIAILDGGFGSAQLNDQPADREIVGSYNDPNPVGCGGGPCPWHGTLVSQAAMAIPDNGVGVAGPAGPVARALYVNTPSPDVFELIEYAGGILFEATADTPDIVNISAGGRIPASAAALLNPVLDSVGFALRTAGILPIVSAGNDGDNLDAEDCFIVCWEEATYIPCENDGFVCVGGLKWNSTVHADNSNYGRDSANSQSTVNIFGPYTMILGPTPGDSDIKQANGTSYSSPFVAGIAALVMAADPSLSDDQVVDILYRTANTGSSSSRVPRWVNAYDAVIDALGGVPAPVVELLSPADGSGYTETERIEFSARALVIEGSADYTWLVDGTEADRVVSSSAFGVADLCPGNHTVGVRIGDGTRTGNTAERTVSVANRTPEVTILTAPSSVGEDTDFIVEGTASDPSCTDLAGIGVDPAQLDWSLNGSPIGSGAALIAQVANQGSATLTLGYTDARGATGSASATIDVGASSGTSDPVVAISRPMGIDGEFISYFYCDGDGGHTREGVSCPGDAYEIAFEAIASSSVSSADLVWEYRERLGGDPYSDWFEITGASGTSATLRIGFTGPDNRDVEVRLTYDPTPGDPNSGDEIRDLEEFTLQGIAG